MIDKSGLDWDVLSLPGVEFTAVQAAESVANNQMYKDHVEFDDLAQEAFVLIASMGSHVRQAVEGGEVTLGAIKYRIEMDLIDKSKTPTRRGLLNESYDVRYAESDGDTYRPRTTSTVRQDIGAYNEELVETLLPAVWDETYCYGIRVENAPDDDMPRGGTNKATGNTLSAHIADIKWAWVESDLRLSARRALVMRFGLDWDYQTMGYNQGCSKQSIDERIQRGVKAILRTLNGAECASEGDDDEKGDT